MAYNVLVINDISTKIIHVGNKNIRGCFTSFPDGK